jgi:hypothetical protein
VVVGDRGRGPEGHERREVGSRMRGRDREAAAPGYYLVPGRLGFILSLGLGLGRETESGGALEEWSRRLVPAADGVLMLKRPGEAVRGALGRAIRIGGMRCIKPFPIQSSTILVVVVCWAMSRGVGGFVM